MMKKGFFILFLAILFVFSSCGGDDPVEEEEINDNSQENSGISDDSGNQESSDTSLPDPDASDNENSEKNDDGSNSKPDDDKTNDDGTDDNGQATGDDDGTTDSNGDTDEPQSDDDADSGNGTTDDTDQTDGDTDDPADDTDADADTADPDEDTDVDTGADSGEEDPDNLTVTLPYGGAPVDKTITLDTKINKIDVLLMVDLSPSMSAVHNNLQANNNLEGELKNLIVKNIRAKIPDSAFGFVKFGTVKNNAYELVQPITTDENNFRNAINTLVTVATDSPSRTYHGLALWRAASGEEVRESILLCKDNYSCSPSTQKPIVIDPVVCNEQNEGSIGGACFREKSMPVFVMASSQKFNDFLRPKNSGDSKDEWKETDAYGNHYVKGEKTAAEAAKKMKEINAKFIGVSYKTTDPDNGFTTVAKGTVSQDTAATNFNISVEDGDSEFSSKIAEAVKNLTENIKMTVTASLKHVENSYGVADTTKFVKSFYPNTPQPVKAGTPLILNPITFENKDYDNPDCEPHTFKVTLEATGEGLILDTREITVIVPGKDCSSEAH